MEKRLLQLFQNFVEILELLHFFSKKNMQGECLTGVQRKVVAPMENPMSLIYGSPNPSQMEHHLRTPFSFQFCRKLRNAFFREKEPFSLDEIEDDSMKLRTFKFSCICSFSTKNCSCNPFINGDNPNPPFSME